MSIFSAAWPARDPMSDAALQASHRALKLACLMAIAGALAVALVRAMRDDLWLDELLTLALLQAHSLPKLWSGIVLGIDANPPIYLTSAWLVAHALPASVPVAVVLKLANVAMTIGALAALSCASLRMVSPPAAWAGALLLAALNDQVLFVALEMRTYAAYFLFAALTVLLQQRLIDHNRHRDLIALALANVGLALSHNFGIAYVLTIALAGALSQWSRGWRQSKPIALAVAPALLAFTAWLPFVIKQSAVGQPYLWFGPPDAATLLQSLFASPLAMWISLCELYALAGVAIWLVAKRRIDLATLLRGNEWQSYRYGVLIALGLSGFLLTVWIISVVWFPMFVPRYFAPQLIAGFLLHAAFAQMILWWLRSRALSTGLLTIAAPAALLCAVLLTNDSMRRDTPCADTGGLPFERAFVRGDLPVVVDSPHIFMPRANYAAHSGVYRFPLDWDVVLNYRDRTRGNATDFHIFENLKTWAGMSLILSTDDILRTQPRFLAIEHSSRAWFHNLRQTRDVTADKLAETTNVGGTCTLWNVTSVKPLP